MSHEDELAADQSSHHNTPLFAIRSELRHSGCRQSVPGLLIAPNAPSRFGYRSDVPAYADGITHCIKVREVPVAFSAHRRDVPPRVNYYSIYPNPLPGLRIRQFPLEGPPSRQPGRCGNEPRGQESCFYGPQFSLFNGPIHRIRQRTFTWYAGGSYATKNRSEWVCRPRSPRDDPAATVPQVRPGFEFIFTPGN